MHCIYLKHDGVRDLANKQEWSFSVLPNKQTCTRHRTLTLWPSLVQALNELFSNPILIDHRSSIYLLPSLPDTFANR